MSDRQIDSRARAGHESLAVLHACIDVDRAFIRRRHADNHGAAANVAVLHVLLRLQGAIDDDLDLFPAVRALQQYGLKDVHFWLPLRKVPGRSFSLTLVHPQPPRGAACEDRLAPSCRIRMSSGGGPETDCYALVSAEKRGVIARESEQNC